MVTKRKTNYLEWQDKIINQFLFQLLDLAFEKNDLNAPKKLYVPIHILDIPEQLKIILLKFGCYNICDIINDFTEKDLRNENMFKIIVDFQGAWKLEYTVIKK